MAKFNVLSPTYRFSRLHVRGEQLHVPDEELDKHCDSIALTPADEEAKEAILIFAPESRAAGKILAEREAGKKAEAKQEAFKKAKEELAKKAAEKLAAAAEKTAKEAK